MEERRIALDTDCVFCDIAAGAGVASVVHEDPLVLAFLDISPLNAGHTHLHVIPRYTSDSLIISAEWRSPTRRELDAVARDIRSAMG